MITRLAKLGTGLVKSAADAAARGFRQERNVMICLSAAFATFAILAWWVPIDMAIIGAGCSGLAAIAVGLWLRNLSFAGKPSSGIEGVFRHAVLVEALPEGAIALYDKDADVPAVVINKEGRLPAIVTKGDSIFVPLFATTQFLGRTVAATEDILGFSALEAALNVVNPLTGAPFNARIVVGYLDLASLSDAYSEVEKHKLRVARVFMNPQDYDSIRHRTGGQSTGLNTYFDEGEGLVEAGTVVKLWGADVIVSTTVNPGTVYVCADKESLGVMPERFGHIGICIHNPRGVASVSIGRSRAKRRPRFV